MSDKEGFRALPLWEESGDVSMKEATPIHYKIHIEPDLQNFAFSGKTEILMEATEPVREVSLNLLDLAVWSCKVKVGEEFVSCSFSVNPKKEEITISLPEEMEAGIHLKIEYMGEINNRMAGLYRSKYVVDGQEKYIAVTQFEESDARRAFPCFDHPVQKATFDVEMTIDETLEAISNGPVVEEKRLGAGKKWVKFQRTPKMSTYLLFFGVGAFESIEDSGKVLVRVATMPGMKKFAEFGLQFARKSLEFSEKYYGIKYPLPKLDLIAIPDFAAGAMENWGAITFRENLLLQYPNITSRAGNERICEVIAHETAHQWFGNLVTPSDWKYLWLNESFATYFGYHVVNHYYPEWDVWDQFVHEQTDRALDRDSLHETFSIEIPGGEHVVINASTAPIIYSKGGSILRQVEGYIGKEGFRDGLRRYLKKHEYGCASSHHLWEALEEVSAKPVIKVMRSWIEQPGLPVVEAKRQGDRLLLSQRRFTYLPNESEQEWLIPLAIEIFQKDGRSRTMSTLLDAKSAVVDLGSNAVSYKVNHGQRGFYRVRYLDRGDLEDLAKRVLERGLSPEDRWGLQNDLYALVRNGDVSLDDYLEFLSNYSNEDAFLPLTSIMDNLFHAYLIMGGTRRETVASIGLSLLEKVLSNIGCEPRSDERHTTSILRDRILWHATVYGSEQASAFAREKFALLIHNGSIHPDIMKSVMQVGALYGDDKAFDWFQGRFSSSESEHERMNILAALGSFKGKGLIERIRQYVLDKVPDRNKFVTIGFMSANPHAGPYMWEWFVSNLDRLEKFHPMHYERVIASIVPIGGIGKEDEVKSFFGDYTEKKEKARDVIRLSLERLEINSRMRRREMGETPLE